MYSSASVTDLDSDDYEYPNYDCNVDDNSSSSSSCNNSVQKSQSCRVHQFGEFEENYGWIQCLSKSYPDRVYYHNTRSGCHTWYRPISRYVNIPFVSIRRANYTDDTLESANDLELMSVSDDEKDPTISRRVSARDQNNSLIDVSDVIARYYYISKIDSSPNSHSSTDDDASDGYEKKKEQVDVNDDDEDEGDSKAVCSPLYAANFLETEFVMGKDEVDTERINPRFNFEFEEDASNSPSFRTRRVVYGKPRLKKIGPKSLLIKPRRTRVYKTQEASGPRKIISDMYGVRTISYDLPEPDQPCAMEGVKITTLSGSDSDASEPPSPSRCVKTTRSFKPEYRDLANLRQPLLSDASSSPSSRSDSSSSTSRSTGSSSSSSSSSCSCSSCSCNKKA